MEFKVGDRVRRTKYENVHISAGDLGTVTKVNETNIVVKFDKYHFAQQPYNRKSAYKYIEKLEEPGVLKTCEPGVLKTWEMIRQIGPGERYELVNFNKLPPDRVFNSIVEFHTRGIGLVWEDQTPVLITTTLLAEAEWRKIPKQVDFPEAWAAYEEGKYIRSEGQKYGYRKEDESEGYADKETFTPNQIRGKWTIED